MPPEAKEILGLPDLFHESTYYDKQIYLYGKLKNRPPCPKCQNPKPQIKASFKRELRHFKMGNQITVVRFTSHKFRCPRCNCYFNLKLQGTLPKRRSTENFRLDVFERHQGGVTQKHLSLTHEISHATVERWYQGFIKARVSELSGRQVPIVLGIDEHFFTKKKGYATTFVDLKNHKVFDVVLGRSEKSLRQYLRKMPNKKRVKVVVMDLSSTYRSIVEKYFPNAMIVADRFHVIRLINQHFVKVWGQFDPVGRKSRGLLSLIRRHEENLKPEQRVKLERYFLDFPHIKTMWEFKQKLTNLMRLKHLSKDTTWLKIHDFLPMLEELKASAIDSFKTLGETLDNRKNEIGRMWRFSKTNSITEGLHNKMEMISRRAFGFRNFNNYRLRVLALCGWNGVINRKRKLKKVLA